MKTDIYYFTGSGNSLDIAQKISEQIKDSNILSIPKITSTTNEITGDIIGIVCPIYYHNMPHMVRQFIKKIKKANYVFMVYSDAELGLGDRKTKTLFASHNIKLNALYTISMPDNSTRYGEIPVDKQNEMFSNADRKIKTITKLVKSRGTHFDSRNIGFFQAHVYPGMVFKFIYNSLKKMDNDFSVDETCNGCGLCENLCPVNNLTMKNKKPEWHKNNKCEVCLACFDWCPQSSIKNVHTKDDVKRYHNPHVSNIDIIKSSSKI